jgi:hypothetical protein
MLKYMPASFQQSQFRKAAGYRPQIRFMPLAENRGSIPVLPQKPCKKYEEKLRREAAAAAAPSETTEAETSVAQAL